MIHIISFETIQIPCSTHYLACQMDRRDWRKSVRCDIGDGCGEKDTNITWAQAEVEDLVG